MTLQLRTFPQMFMSMFYIPVRKGYIKMSDAFMYSAPSNSWKIWQQHYSHQK